MTFDFVQGGKATTADEFPWHVSIALKKNGLMEHACGGVLISNDFVLTAAHCLSNFAEENQNKTHCW